MTNEIFSRDAYQASAEATVVEVRDDGFVLDRTVFYARGGGQPGDMGTPSSVGKPCRCVSSRIMVI